MQRVQKVHSKALGFMPRKALEGKIRLGQILVAELGFVPGGLGLFSEMASEGYPEAPITGRAITGLDAASAVPGVTVLHAATVLAPDGGYVSGTDQRQLF